LIALAAIPSKTEGCVNESGNTLSEYRLKYFYDNRTSNPIASKTMLCLAADDGSSEARYLLGDIFWFGTETERNLNRAYVWYRLSEDCGHYWASKAVQRMQKLLTQNELAEAEESLKDWKPGQCQIELKLP
jgi:TPR repeat protein